MVDFLLRTQRFSFLFLRLSNHIKILTDVAAVLSPERCQGGNFRLFVPYLPSVFKNSTTFCLPPVSTDWPSQSRSTSKLQSSSLRNYRLSFDESSSLDSE